MNFRRRQICLVKNVLAILLEIIYSTSLLTFGIRLKNTVKFLHGEKCKPEGVGLDNLWNWTNGRHHNGLEEGHWRQHRDGTIAFMGGGSDINQDQIWTT